MFKAFAAYRKASGFLFRHELSWFLWFPLIITLLVFFGGFSLTSWATKHISDSIDLWLEGVDWLPEWLSFLQDVFYWILWLILRIILYFVFAFFGGTVILILMAPVLTWLSEKVAESLNQEVASFSVAQFMRDLSRATGLALRNGLIQLGLSVVCFLIGFIPIVGAFSPVLLFVINAYFYGFNFLDYSLERRRFTVSESSTYVWRHKLTTFSIGSPFALWMLIPFVGPMSAGFVAIFSTVAATIETERLAAQSTEVNSI